MAETVFRARSSFAVPGDDGLPRVIQEGVIVGHDDPALRSRRELFEPMSDYIERTTQAPGEKRPVRMPSAVTNAEATKARDVRNGPRTTKEDDMPHELPPEDENSAASPFAPGQPAAGVVADDVPDEQNPAGGVHAADAPRIENTPPDPQTPLQEDNAKDAKSKAKGK